MSTFLREKIVFGPIHSRRLGNSLGVNILPQGGKICNFDCIYCECGWNKDGHKNNRFPSLAEIIAAAEEYFRQLSDAGTEVDSITFSGNGEPTLHPDFPKIAEAISSLRDRFLPDARISVLSNATNILRKDISEALMKIDNPILKIDSSDENIIRIINRPVGNYSLESIVRAMECFNGNFILQTMFLKNLDPEHPFDLSCDTLAEEWVRLVLRLRPRLVMMYTLDRDTPSEYLEKVSAGRMKEIAAPIIAAGIKVQIAE